MYELKIIIKYIGMAVSDFIIFVVCSHIKHTDNLPVAGVRIDFDPKI